MPHANRGAGSPRRWRSFRDRPRRHRSPGASALLVALRGSRASRNTDPTGRLDGYSAAVTKRAFITGITGQDGSYLAEFLLAKDYEVHGLVRRASTLNRSRIDHLHDPRLHLHYG